MKKPGYVTLVATQRASLILGASDMVLASSMLTPNTLGLTDNVLFTVVRLEALKFCRTEALQELHIVIVVMMSP